MRSIFLISAFAASLLSVPSVRALETFKVYDLFSTFPLDPERWADTERVRLITGDGSVRLMQRTWGTRSSDAGVTAQSWSTNFSNPATINEMKARITVNAIDVKTCASNPAVTESRARIIGGFFNVGTPTPGSQANDVIAQVRLSRASNSSDPAGLLHVQGILSLCVSADCNSASTIGNIVDLGTVKVGAPATVQIQWDQPGKTFHFARSGSTTAAGTVAYAQSDASPPSVLFRQLSTRVTLANCQSAPRVKGMVDAVFDNVYVNQSALP
ncbi:MAG: hypothetical protein ABI699_00125 [Caldimonas sp.]